MALIQLTTRIAAPVERVFDLARSVEAHTASVSQTGEIAIDGKTSGLVEEGDTVTWEATHFGIKQRLKVQMTQVERPSMFEDRMVFGAFSSMSHQHRFEEKDGETEMRDRFEFQAPLGILGRIAERLFLTRYMTTFLQMRNEGLKELAESDRWRRFLEKDAHYDGDR
tara:strand:- start:4385 stop:4885 length:501 start_codon:yes stop_codon:yes gene_type:complete